MANTQQLRKNIHYLQAIKTWQLAILFILALFVAATFLRLNNTGMIARRNAVTAADKAGDVQEIQSRIYDLQRYSASHMNADSGILYLQEQYNRDTRDAMKVNDTTGANSPQARADAICHPQFRGYSTAYLNCMVDEIAKQGNVTDPASLKLPSPALYRYSFASPVWSPDFAGWSVVVAVIIMLMMIGRLLMLALLRILLKRQYRQL